MQSGGSMTDVLRRAIKDSGLTHYALSKATGVIRASIDRFVAGEQSIRLDRADTLAAYLGIVATKRKTT